MLEAGQGSKLPLLQVKMRPFITAAVTAHRSKISESFGPQ